MNDPLVAYVQGVLEGTAPEVESEQRHRNAKELPARKDTECTEDSSLPEEMEQLEDSRLSEEMEQLEEFEKEEKACGAQNNRRCRTSRACCQRCMMMFISFIFIACMSLLAAIFLGARREAKHFGRAVDTVDLYSVEPVCALNDDDSMSTFLSADAAHTEGLQVAHCGNCGGCSSVHDVSIYAETRNTLTRDASMCGLASFLGLKLAARCFDQRVGFSRPCERCWTENIGCTKANCKWTCLKYKLLRQSNNDGDDESLNPCLKW
jgi:hypothetical protein